MPKRMTVFASATLAVLVCALVLSVHSSSGQAAADNCLAKPNAAPPQGSHWFYRVDKVGNRRCWYLGAKDAKPRQAWSPKPQPALNPQPKPAPQLMATASAATPAQLVARAADASATSSALPTSANAVDGEPASAIDGAGEHAGMHPEDDMPLTSCPHRGRSRRSRGAARMEPQVGAQAGLCCGRAGTAHDRAQGFQTVRHPTTSPPSPDASRAMESGAGDALARTDPAGIRRRRRGNPPGSLWSQLGCGTAYRRDPTPTGR